MCLIAHGLEVLGDAVQEDGAAPQMIDICLGYLVVGLNEHHLVAEVSKAGLNRQLAPRALEHRCSCPPLKVARSLEPHP